MIKTPEYIKKLDQEDVLADKRDAFLLPENIVYMDGNSLGPSTKAARSRVVDTLQHQWQQDLIASWNKHGWIDLPKTVASKIAPLIGASPDSVTCCDSISVNLFKMIAAALDLNTDRNVVISEQRNFPTDLYVADGLQQLVGERRCTLRTVEKSNIEKVLDETVAVLMLTHVDFRSGEMLDMQALTQAAHDNGTLVMWDLAHSAGAVPLNLDDLGVDFAVGCGYKYLNGGPGSPAFVYVNQQHLPLVKQPLRGWMGHQSPFEFRADYEAADSIDKFLCGTPPILSMAALDGALDVFHDVSMSHVRAKSNALKQCFLDTLESAEIRTHELVLITPTESSRQGSQLSFTHSHAYALSQALIDHGVIVDFRAPNIVRFGFTPLYLSFADVYHAAQTLAELLNNGRYREPQYSKRAKVT